MKILIVGGHAQGKQQYAQAVYGLSDSGMFTGGKHKWDNGALPSQIYRLHDLLADFPQQGIDPLEWARDYMSRRKEWLIVCDEVGCGVVPVEKSDRDWREAVGRVCCELAREADIVERVYCGMPLRLKGDVSP